MASADYGSAIGFGNTASGPHSSAIGDSNKASAEGSSAVGRSNMASGSKATAVGWNNTASGVAATAVGGDSDATANYSVALGYQSIADRANTVSVGSASKQRQIVNVADGTEAYDAVNLRQLNGFSAQFVSWLGGGAAFSGGIFTAPSYVIQGQTYRNVGAAFAAVDEKLTMLSGDGAAGSAMQPMMATEAVPMSMEAAQEAATEASPGDGTITTTTGTTPVEGTTTGAKPQGKTKAMAHTPATPLAAAADETSETTPATASSAEATGVAPGSSAPPTLAEAQAYSSNTTTQTLASANAYADFRVAALEDDFLAYRGEVDERLRNTDRRLDRQGAMGSAMLNMAINAAGTQSPRGRVAVGIGYQNGENAMSVGYGRKIGERASLSVGGAFSGDEKTIGAGFGMDL
jgi:autotransporter adhesin